MYISGLVSLALAKAPRPNKQKTRERYERRWPSSLRSFWPLVVVAAFRSSLFVAAAAKKSNWSSLSTAPWLSYFGHGLVSSLILEALKAMLPPDHSAAPPAAAHQVAPNGKNPPENKFTFVVSRFLFQDKFPLDFRFRSLYELYSEFVKLLET